MKKRLTTLAVIITIVITASPTMAQNSNEEVSDNTELRKFGLGLHVEQFRLQDIMSSNFVPVNNLIFTISPSNKWRLEPSIGFTKSKDENKNNFSSSENTQSGIFYGIGGFGMYQAGKTNLYFGVRVAYGTITSEYKSFDNSGVNSYFSKDETKRFMVGPVVGAEFFFGRHLSFGGEVALKNYSSKTTSTDTNNPTPDPDEENNGNYFSTETGLLLRFYF